MPKRKKSTNTIPNCRSALIPDTKCTNKAFVYQVSYDTNIGRHLEAFKAEQDRLAKEAKRQEKVGSKVTQLRKAK